MITSTIKIALKINTSKMIMKVFIKETIKIAVRTKPSRYSFFQGLKKVAKRFLNEKRWTNAKKIQRSIFSKVIGACVYHQTINSTGIFTT